MSRPVPALCTAAGILVSLAAPLAAQQSVAAGRVLRITGRDTLPVPRATVTMHRVGRDAQGPVDSTIAGPRGEFRFRYTADTSAVYLLSSGWAGIEYFSSPLHTTPGVPDTGLVLVVSDTSSTVPVTVTSRHLVISKPGSDGSRAALEIVVIANAGQAARIAPDSTHPSWAAAVPAGVIGFRPGSGDFSADALVFRNDSVMLFAPVAPGEKQVLFTYSLPPGSGRVRIPVGDSIGIFNILLEEFDRTVRGGGLVRGDSQAIEGHTFLQWSGGVGAGSEVTIDFPSGGRNWILPALVTAVALSLAVVAFRTFRRRPAPAGASPLLDRLARLDAQYAGREAVVPAEEWARYQAERARLKSELTAELARTRASS